MAQLTVRNVESEVVVALKKLAAAHGRSAEAEHRELLRRALLDRRERRESFSQRAANLRRRLRSDLDSAELIRADRGRDTST